MDAAQAHVVVVLTRAPSAGGKSRLFAALGRPPDASLLIALLLDTLDGVAIPDVQRVVAVDPATACEEIRTIVPADVRVVPQPPGSLGDRMAAVMRQTLDAGAAAVVLIGSDLPAMTAAPVMQAFETLQRNRDAIVLGPAVDGGYYLIAATRVPDVFDGIAWGGAGVLDQTRAAAARARLNVHLLEPMCDIDSIEDLELLVRVANTRDPGKEGPRGGARRTLEWARTHGVGAGK